MKFGRILARTVQVKDVDEAKNTAEINDSMQTIATFGADVRVEEADMGPMEVTQTYALAGSGMKQGIQMEVRSEYLGAIKAVGDSLQLFTFPSAAMEPQKKYAVEMESVVKDLPERWKEPPKLEVALTGRVLFDGQEAYRMEIEHTGYSALEVPVAHLNLTEPVKMKTRSVGKYYVSAKTGRVLWSETKQEIVDSTLPLLKGAGGMAREELVPE